MKFYVYNDNEIQLALKAIEDKFHGKVIIDNGEVKTDKVSYNWISLGLSDLISIMYPSGSLWNRKIHELLQFPYSSLSNPEYFLVPVAILFGSSLSLKSKLVEFEEIILSEFLYRLPYYHYNKERHVFFIIGDSYSGPNLLKDSILFRCSCHKNSNNYSLYFDVLLNRSFIQPIKDCVNLCAFTGCLDTHPLRRKLPKTFDNIKDNKIFDPTSKFFCHLPLENQKIMQLKWTEALQTSKFILCPRGCGLNSIRFFEALSFGRIPVLIADDAKLPLEDIIDYDDFVVKVPELDICNSYEFINKFNDTHDIEISSIKALETWERYFSDGKLIKYIELSLPENKNTINKILT